MSALAQANYRPEADALRAIAAFASRPLNATRRCGPLRASHPDNFNQEYFMPSDNLSFEERLARRNRRVADEQALTPQVKSWNQRSRDGFHV